MVARRMFIVVNTALLFALVLLSAPAIPAEGEEYYYSFNVESEKATCVIEKDGGATIHYSITFANHQHGQILDIVDIGMPNSRYDLDSAKAWLDGHPIYDIRKSEVIDVGVEIHLGGYSIQPGSTGTLRFRCRDPVMVFPDTEDDNYASVEFRPTWFSDEYCTGVDELNVTMIFPPGVDIDHCKYHRHEYHEWGHDSEGRVYYQWNFRNQPSDFSDDAFKFGVSFPKKHVNKVYDPYWDVEFRDDLPCYGAAVCFVVFIILIVFFSIYSQKAKKHYIRPKLFFQGAGVRLGLTAPEAGVVLDVPMDKMLMMILFGLIKKGAVHVVENKPDLKIDYVHYNDLRDYELDFLRAFTKGKDGHMVPDKKLMKKVMVNLINSVKKKMKGYSFEETRRHYKGVVDKAWSTVSRADTPEVKSSRWDENYDWLMLHDDYGSKSRTEFGGTVVYYPVWYHYWLYPRGGHLSSSYSRSYGGWGWYGSPSMPKLPGSEFADGIVSSIESGADSLVGSIPGFESSVKATTNPMSAQGGVGGGSGGCACACAGCACACAGGGR